MHRSLPIITPAQSQFITRVTGLIRLFSLTISLLLVGVQVTWSQTRSIQQWPDKPAFSLEQQGSIYTASWASHEGTTQHQTNLAAPVDVIVEFVEAPFFAQRQAGKTVRADAFKARFNRLASDLAAIHAPLSKNATLSPPKITHEYYKVFFGASVRLARSALPEVHRLDYVKRIHFDHKVVAHLNESVPLIGADRIWTDLDTQGDGVVVAVLDTGIDYMHPALGGGFGSEFKVIGGYDFVNADADPMDDNGHGTHVAGIIAADSDDVKGVAPKARLLAYKVLDQNGESPTSLVVEAIERLVDPNQDDDPSDRPDVVNISLGSQNGSPDDPKSLAVDNATALGVTFCISAGNHGEYRSIGSPGMARSAITVGASDKSDHITEYSSRGPNDKTFSIKPDIVAPGHQITSTLLGGGTVTYNGTSMAAPHVTGTAALLKALHPDWTPGHIKSAIMTTAKHLYRKPLEQGAGRLDAWRAAQTTAFAIPSHLSFGLDDDTLPAWTTSQTITVENQAEQAQDFTVTGYTSLSGSITVSPSPDAFTLAPGQTQEVVFTLSVDNDRLSYRPSGSSLSYSGFLDIKGTLDELRLPWAFAKTVQVSLTFDQPNAEVFLTSKTEPPLYTSTSGQETDPYSVSFVGFPPATYDLLAINVGNGQEPPRILVKEGWEVSGSETLFLGEADAPHRLDLNGVDAGGRLLSQLPNAAGNHRSRLLLKLPQDQFFINEVVSIAIASDAFRVSDISEQNTLLVAESSHTLGAGDEVFFVQYPPIQGMSQSLALSNQPESVVAQPVRVEWPPDAANPNLELLHTLVARRESNDFIRYGMVTGSVNVPNGSWEGTLYLTPDASEALRGTIRLRARLDTTEFASGLPWFYTPDFRVVQSKAASFDFETPAATVPLGGSEAMLRFGEGLIYPDFLIENSAQQIAVNVDFKGALDERRVGASLDARYELFDASGTLIASGAVSDAETNRFAVFEIDASPGSYQLSVTNSNYYVGSLNGTARFDAFIDTGRPDPNPPMISALKVLNTQGLPVSTLEQGEAATLQLAAADYHKHPYEARPIRTDSTKAYYRLAGTDHWQSIPLDATLQDYASIDESRHRPIGDVYEADLSEITQRVEGAIDLRFRIQDETGNVTEWTLEPAFIIGDVQVNTEAPDEAADVPHRFALHGNYPNPFRTRSTIQYDLSHREHVRLLVYDVLGRKVAVLHDGVQPAGEHQAVFEAAGRAPGVYFYRLETNSFTATRRMILMH